MRLPSQKAKRTAVLGVVIVVASTTPGIALAHENNGGGDGVCSVC